MAIVCTKPAHAVLCCVMCCAVQSLDLGVYYGFNLLVGDLHSRQVAYVSNRDPWGPRELAPGHYGEHLMMMILWCLQHCSPIGAYRHMY